jgi:hypothetical protein
MQTTSRWIAGVVVGVALVGVAQAQQFTVTRVDVPFPGASDTVVTGIGPTGAVVGIWLYHGSQTHSFRKASGKAAVPVFLMTLIGLNSSGESAGWYMPQGQLAGLRYDGMELLTINCPEAALTEAAGVTDTGIVVGDYYDLDEEPADGSAPNPRFRSFVWDPGTGQCTGFDVPIPDNYSGSGATGANLLGEIVGGVDHHGYLRSPDGTFTIIDVPGADLTLPRGINNKSLMVGVTCTAGVCQCFKRGPQGNIGLWGVPGATLTDCSAVNDRTDMAGRYIDAAGVSHGFIARRK